MQASLEGYSGEIERIQVVLAPLFFAHWREFFHFMLDA
jgi:hypothetical protein